MNTKALSTRRLFFWKAGAALSAPLVVATAGAAVGNVEDAGALQARLAKLEDVDAIRALHRAYVKHVNARAHRDVAALFADAAAAQVDDGIRRLSADDFGEQAVIEVAADRETATARLPCIVQTETAIEPSSTLVQMAREQGEGVLKRAERRVLEQTYVRRRGAWRIERSTLASA